MIGNILEGIYGNDSSAVLVFDLEGRLLWHNGSAERVMEKYGISVEAVFLAIERAGGSEGGLRIAGGGNFRKADICGIELYIAEIYSESRLTEVFSTPFFEKFVNYSDSQVRQAVTSISASCEFINDTVEHEDSGSVSECLENIMAGCCRLMRNLTVSSQLAIAASGKNVRNELINFRDFMRQISIGCASVVGSERCVICTDAPDCYVRTDSELLTTLILMLVRKIMPHKSMKLRFETSSDGEYAEIRIRSEELEASDEAEKISNSEAVFGEAYGIIARKLGVEYVLSVASASVRMQCVSHNGEVVLECKRLFLSGNTFTPCRIMLSDLTDSRNFY